LAGYAYQRHGGREAFLLQLDSFTLRRWSEALRAAGRYGNSIRLLARYHRLRGTPVSLAEAKMLYPRPFFRLVEEVSRDYGLPEHIFYALVREESYFDPAVSSGAGAVGLAQLMPSTARDIASRIGMESYDLTDPEVNLRLGGWYLRHLRGRTESYLRALFAYNGGITRVRRWSRNFGHLPEELVLESIPYAETRHYGRKVLVSAVIYGYLYHGRTPGSVVEEIFGARYRPPES
jgi:soluble lytic murein transglycosylase